MTSQRSEREEVQAVVVAMPDHVEMLEGQVAAWAIFKSVGKERQVVGRWRHGGIAAASCLQDFADQAVAPLGPRVAEINDSDLLELRRPELIKPKPRVNVPVSDYQIDAFVALKVGPGLV